MKTLVAAAFALAIGVVAPATSALAFDSMPRHGIEMRESRGTVWTGFHDDRTVERDAYAPCPMSSAAEGNANQQTRPVMQYGQTSGGNRC